MMTFKLCSVCDLHEQLKRMALSVALENSHDMYAEVLKPYSLDTAEKCLLANADGRLVVFSGTQRIIEAHPRVSTRENMQRYLAINDLQAIRMVKLFNGERRTNIIILRMEPNKDLIEVEAI